MIHPDQAISTLEALDIQKSRLSPQGQKILEELTSMAYTLQVSPGCFNLPIAIAESLINDSRNISQINFEVDSLNITQKHLKQSFLFLNKLKQIKSNLVESTSHLNQEISSCLLPKKKELQGRLQSLTPK